MEVLHKREHLIPDATIAIQHGRVRAQRKDHVAQPETAEFKRAWCFPGGSAGKESACNAGDLGSNPGLGRSPGEGKGYPLQYSGLENSMDCKESDMTEQLSVSLKQ